ncbi:MAG TPA: energy-coupling factor transporter transmembrane component T [Candidatus Limiplasma sp.]|jgi:energy-coupling factor transport system permease protein|nr:energy-coupling factor transporter transmembrane component T [Candidatus Limiplasma sp.]HPR78153.1 energy-coupling factor transporter transmembrane component T [Candidatus Limiplasma sp.]
MLKDITLGQYMPGNTVVHRLDPRTKIALTTAYIVLIFLVRSPLWYVVPALYIALAARLAGLSFGQLLKSIKPLRFLLVLTFVLNLFFSGGTTVWVHWSIFTITQEGALLAVHFCMRLVFLVVGTSVLTLTTSPVALSDGIEILLKPLKVVHFPAHELAMMMTIALRFIPTLIEETDKIMKAQQARGADFETGNLITRAKAMVPLLVPLFVSAFRRAGELAMAMEARCYHGGEGRTRLRVLRFTAEDGWAFLITAAAIAAVVVGQILF